MSEYQKRLSNVLSHSVHYPDLVGGHVHMCPQCFEDVPCDDTCTWYGESVTNQGVPTCHPVICERCELASRFYHDQGAGI